MAQAPTTTKSTSKNGKNMNKNTAELAFKIIESIGWIVGPALFALHFFSFKLGKAGAYYETGSEWGMAVGVFFISLAFVSRLWSK
jgi:hypothetical protein